MATLNLAGITIPTKQNNTPGKDAFNQEMFFGILLDVAAAAKANGFTVSDQDVINLLAKLDTLNTALTTLNNNLSAINTAIQGITLTGGVSDLTTVNAQLTAIAGALV
jgi:hypothetical protein